VWIVKSPSPVKSSSYELSCTSAWQDYIIRRNCDTADDRNSNCKIVNGVNVRASGINSLYAISREVICRVTHPTRDNILIILCPILLVLRFSGVYMLIMCLPDDGYQ
jgi:hypothetical protein